MTTASIGGPSNRHWLGAAFLFVAAFINLLDATIVNLALPAIQNELSATDSQMQWVLVIYVLAFAAGLLPFGRFGDTFGRRRLFLIGLTGFVATSTLCSLAPNIDILIAARLLKGFFGAMMLPQVLAIVHATFPADDKSKAISYFAIIAGLGAVAGPVIGGPLISADLFGLGWRMIFLINLPLGLVSFIGVLTYIKDLTSSSQRQPDWIGALLFAASAVTLMYPLIEGRNTGWSLEMIGMIVFSVVLLTSFWQRQLKLATRNRVQLVPATLLANRRFLSGIIVTTLLFIGVAGPIVVLAITLQYGLGYSAAAAGWILAAHPFVTMLASFLSGRLGTTHLHTRILLGFTALFLGMLSLQCLIANDTSIYLIWGPLALIGGGVGLTTVALFQAVLRQVDPADAGAGSGTLQAFQQIGIAIGIATIGQLFFAGLSETNDPSQYVPALQRALWISIVIYAGLVLLSLRPALQEGQANDA